MREGREASPIDISGNGGTAFSAEEEKMGEISLRFEVVGPNAFVVFRSPNGEIIVAATATKNTHL